MQADQPGAIPEQLLKEAMNTLPTFGSGSDSLNGSPYSSLTQVRLEIVEQPKSRGFRFRYDCEGQSHGGLPGENSERNRKQKTYPTVRLHGYRGRSRVMVSLVTDTEPPMPHAHSIVGKNAIDGRCMVEVGPETDMYAQFTNLGILHVTKKKVPEVLTRRLIQQANLRGSGLEPMDTDQPLNPSDMEHVKQEAGSLSKTMNLSVVRLCFQAFLPDEHGRFTIPVEPVFSHKVYDSKAPSAGTLKICRLDKTSGSVKGGDDIFLLCDKVQKNDIEVVFYEDRPGDTNGMNVQPWVAKGRFGPNDVHHQYAIVFQTPAFYNQAIEHPVQVWISLRRPSDVESSDPKPFLYLPQEFDEERIGQKRRKKINHFNNFFGDGTGGAGGAAGGGGGGYFKDFGGFGNFGGGGTGFNFFNPGSGSQGGGSGPTGGGGGGGGGFNPTSSSSLRFPSSTSSSTSNSVGPPFMVDLPLSSAPGTYGGYQMNSTHPSQQIVSQSSHHPYYAATATASDNYTSGQYSSFGVGRQFNPSQIAHFYPNSDSQMQYMMNPKGLPPGVPAIKQEPYDPTIERDSTTSAPPSAKSHSGDHGYMRSKDMPPPPHGDSGKLLAADVENAESGFVEPSERVDSGLPTSMETESTPREHPSEIESQRAMQALKDRQQMAFEVCDRMFNALLAWATTKDVRYLLAAQRSLTAVQNQEGDTALHLAIIHNHQDVVLQLLDVLPQLPPTETPVVDCLNNFKQSPLHLAVITRQHKVIQYLLKANSNPLVCDRNGDTPLHLACKYGFLQGIMPLLSRSSRINTEGCRIPELTMRNNDGLTPLHLAASCGNADSFRQLAKANADVNVQDSKSGKTALHYLIEKGDLPLTGMLVTEPETNVECADFSGNTALHCAAAQGNMPIVSLLIAAGASLTCQNQEGETPLLLAEYGKHDQVVKILREALQQAGLDKPEEQLSSQMQSVTIADEQQSMAEGDLDRLDFRPRISLALLLDTPNEGHDWRALAHQLHLQHLISGLQSMTSPTKELLNMLEAMDGNVAVLRQSLLAIGRSDAVDVIDRFLKEEGSTASSAQSRSAPVYSKDLPRVMVDSGISSTSGSIPDSMTNSSSSVGSPLPTSAGMDGSPYGNPTNVPSTQA